MKYLTQFANLAAYNAAKGSLDRPGVSLILDGGAVRYNKVVAQVGSYLFSDLTFGSEIGSKTPIAVCVAPASHFADGKARWMSLVNMSATDPENGTKATGNDSSTNDGAGFCWGYNQASVQGITDFDSYPKILATDAEAVSEDNPMGFLDELSESTGNYLIRDYDNGIVDNIYPFDTNRYGLGTMLSSGIESKMDQFIPCPFNQDGSKNELYGSEGDVTSDIDGAANTAAIIALASKYATGAITRNDYSEGSYPAAVACHRFTAGVASLAGQWYLPALGELGYLIASITLINTKLTAAGNAAVGIGVRADYTGATDTYDTLGTWLWSSSESSDLSAWGLGTYGGNVSNAAKDNGGGYRRVRAFLAY